VRDEGRITVRQAHIHSALVCRLFLPQSKTQSEFASDEKIWEQLREPFRQVFRWKHVLSSPKMADSRAFLQLSNWANSL